MSRPPLTPSTDRDIRDLLRRVDSLERKASGPRWYGPFISGVITLNAGTSSAVTINHPDVGLAANSYFVLSEARGTGNAGIGIMTTARNGTSTTLYLTNGSGVGVANLTVSIYLLV